MRYLDLCTSALAIFFSKIQYQITSRTILKCFNIKNIKMKPPVVLFKKMITKMARRHAKAYQHSA